MGGRSLGVTPYETKRPCGEVWLVEVEAKGYQSRRLTLRSRSARGSTFVPLAAEPPPPTPRLAPPPKTPEKVAEPKPKPKPAKKRKPRRRVKPRATVKPKPKPKPEPEGSSPLPF